jgi:CheY-like chemotaxis protein
MRFRNVLVVDDSQDQADVLVALLRQEPGVVAVSCTNAATALDLLDQDWKIDLVVSDYMMPGIDGLELASEIRRARPEIPVVLVTGHDEAIDRIAAGGGIALLKPFTVEALRSVLREHLPLPSPRDR